MKKELVIVGGGFAGIYTYTSLPRWVKQNYRVTLIDQNNYFLFTPLLHEVATGGLNVHHVVDPFEKILDAEARIITDTVVGFDPANKNISLERHDSVSYDVMVMALGSQTNFFNTQGACDHCFTLKNLKEAQALKDHFIDVFQQASMIDNQEKRKELLSTVVIGGGPTGVELAAEIAEMFFITFQEFYRGNFNVKEDASITLLNAGPSLLSPFSSGSQYYAKKTLEEKGVKVKNRVRVTEVKEGNILSQEDDTIPAYTTVWTAGVTPQTVGCPEYIDKEGNGLKVSETLQLEDYPEVFILGDMALVPTEDKRGYPMLAQVAKQQGVQTAKNIERFTKGETLEPFVYRSRGNLASLGNWHAVAEFGGFTLYGPLAWFIWRTVYLVNFASWTKRIKIMVDWTINLFSKRDLTKV